MINMVGQKRLVETFDSFEINTLPKTILLLGPEGCGKTTLILNLANKLNLDCVEITNETTEDELSNYLLDPITKIYRLNLLDFSEKQQNKFLKFIEEPTQTVYVLLESRSEIGVLPTILNRCIKYHFDEYSIDELSLFGSVEEGSLVYKVCKTPGQLVDFDVNSLESLYELCNKLVTKIDSASYANTLGVFTKINYKEDYNLYDFNVFLNTLELCAYEHILANDSQNALIVYQVTNKFKSKYLESNHPVKEQFIVNLLTNLWEEVQKSYDRDIRN